MLAPTLAYMCVFVGKRMPRVSIITICWSLYIRLALLSDVADLSRFPFEARKDQVLLNYRWTRAPKKSFSKVAGVVELGGYVHKVRAKWPISATGVCGLRGGQLFSRFQCFEDLN
jgi:hypothetical protein